MRKLIFCLIAAACIPLALIAVPKPPPAVAAHVNYTDVVKADSPISYWTMNASFYGGILDQMPAANHATTYGPQFVGGGPSGKYAQLDGVDDYFDIGSSSTLRPSGSWSLEAWFRVQPGEIGVFGRLSPTGWEFGVTDFGHVYGEYNGATAARTVESYQGYDDGLWHHAVVTNDGVGLALFVDRVKVTTAATGGDPIQYQSTSTAALGRLGSLNTGYLMGGLDEVAIYGRAITAAEVAEHYDAAHVTTTRHWPAITGESARTLKLTSHFHPYSAQAQSLWSAWANGNSWPSKTGSTNLAFGTWTNGTQYGTDASCPTGGATIHFCPRTSAQLGGRYYRVTPTADVAGHLTGATIEACSDCLLTTQVWNHALCQAVGVLVGVAVIDVNTSLSCMENPIDGARTTPVLADGDQITALYTHTDPGPALIGNHFRSGGSPNVRIVRFVNRVNSANWDSAVLDAAALWNYNPYGDQLTVYGPATTRINTDATCPSATQDGGSYDVSVCPASSAALGGAPGRSVVPPDGASEHYYSLYIQVCVDCGLSLADMRQVACHEMGHILGLNHYATSASCLNLNLNNPPLTAPQATDFLTLRKVYNHLD